MASTKAKTSTSSSSNNNNEVVYGADELCDAASEGRADEAVEILTKDPTLIRIWNVVGDTAFHVAARAGDETTISKMMEFLRMNHVNILSDTLCEGNAEGDTPLQLALKNGHIDVATLLAENQPSVTYQLSVTYNSDDTTDFTPIDATMYKLIVEGKLDDRIKSKVSLEKLKCKEYENSMLHIAAGAGQSQLITELLPITKGIIKEPNKIGDIAFHTAVKAAQYESLKALISWDKYDQSVENINKSLLGEENHEGDTPLHIALENHDEAMVLILVNEYCEACYKLNKKNISPLYLAIKSEYWEVVEQMISYTKQHKDTAEPTLIKGKSVVHAAIEAKKTGILKLILDNHKELIKLVEDDGQSPLSYAAFKGHIEGVEYLLNKFPEYAYECDKEGSFPIHKAACSGNIEVIQKLHMTKNLLNEKGQSILHLAAKNGKSKLVSYLIKMSELARLINLKDEDGNTPLHLATRGLHPRAVYILTRVKRCNTKLQNKKGLTALDIFEVHVDPFPTFEARLTWMALRYVDAPRSSQSIRKSYYKQLGRVGKQKNKANNVKELDGFKKRVDTHMLVATLVATVTFAAGFTLPGGYKQSEKDPNIGMAVLPDKWPFKAFIICNTAALYSSILCVVTLIWAHLGDLKLILVSLKFALPLLGFALVMMSLAFMMGIFVVLRTVPWLSYVVLGMGCAFLFGVLLFFIPLYNPSSIKNSVVRFFFSGTFLLLLLVCEKSSITYA